MARPDSDEPLDRLLSSTLRSHHAAAEVCPEPDLLAAFVDGSLDRSERSSVERHASSCSRCAQILAATEASAQAPVASSQPSIWAVWRAWRWAVPMATAVTVVGVWLAASRPGSPPPSAPAMKAPSATRPATSADGVPQPAHEQQPAGPGSPAPAVASEAKSAERKDVEFPRAARVAPAAPPDEEIARADRAAPERSAKLAKQEAPAAAASADTLRREDAAPSENRKERTLAARADAAVVLVRTTNPNVQWRGRGSTIERSGDGGATWKVERSIEGETVVAGSAPVPDIVWFVTSTGFVMRRTLAGWRGIFVDSLTPIVSIRAVSATQATLGFANGEQLAITDEGMSVLAPQ